MMKSLKISKSLFIGSCVIIITLLLLTTYHVRGTTDIELKSIDFNEHFLTVEAPALDSEIEYSFDNKSWYTAIPTSTASKIFLIDISTERTTSDLKITVRGNRSNSTLNLIILSEKNPSISGVYSAIKNDIQDAHTVAIVKKATLPIPANIEYEYRTSVTGAWQRATASTPTIDVSKLEARGGKVYLREPYSIGNLNSTNQTLTIARPSRIVTVSITKKPTAPSISFNPLKANIVLKSTLEFSVYSKSDDTYARVTSTGSVTWHSLSSLTSIWNPIDTTQKYLDLTIFNGKALEINFRTIATPKVTESLFTNLDIPAVLNDSYREVDSTLYFDYGSELIRFKVDFLSTHKGVYEYIYIPHVNNTPVLPTTTSNWTAINTSTVSLSSLISRGNSSITQKATLYIRKKGTTPTPANAIRGIPATPATLPSTWISYSINEKPILTKSPTINYSTEELYVYCDSLSVMLSNSSQFTKTSSYYLFEFANTMPAIDNIPAYYPLKLYQTTNDTYSLIGKTIHIKTVGSNNNVSGTNGAYSGGILPSKPITFTIPSRPKAPSSSYNSLTKMFTVPANAEYVFSRTAIVPSDNAWITPSSTVFSRSDIGASNSDSGYLYVRTKATASAFSSPYSTLTVPIVR